MNSNESFDQIQAFFSNPLLKLIDEKLKQDLPWSVISKWIEIEEVKVSWFESKLSVKL